MVSLFLIFFNLQNEEAPAQMLENVGLFCEFGGLDAVKECFSSEESQLPISLASCLIGIVAQVSYSCKRL